VDNSTFNNMLLVFDRQAGGGAGAWCGYWQGAALNPVEFFVDNENLIFFSEDGAVRKLFVEGSPYDSDEPLSDIPAYSATRVYEAGDVATYALAGETRAYRALESTVGNLPTTDRWEVVADPWEVMRIESVLETQLYTKAPANGPMQFGTAELVFDHQNPSLVVEQLSRDFQTAQRVFAEAVEFDPTAYDVAGVDPWDQTNINDDFLEPHREDYTLAPALAGIYQVQGHSLFAEVWETHSIRWMPLSVNMHELGLRITNSRGLLRVREVKAKISARSVGGFKR
jgi:hypothetical protein